MDTDSHFEAEHLQVVPMAADTETDTIEKNLLQEVELLGSGTYADCFKIVSNDPRISTGAVLKTVTGNQRLIEWVPGFLMSAQNQLNNEIKILKNCCNKHIVRFLCRVTDQTDPEWRGFLMEFLDLGNLYSFYNTIHDSDHFASLVSSEKFKLRLCRQLALAIAYIHSDNIVHGDISINNVILTLSPGQNNVTLKLGDFGVAFNERSFHGMVTGTPLYRSPEVFCHLRPTKASDVFSFAMVYYFILYERHPLFNEGDIADDIERVMHGLAQGNKITSEFLSHRPDISNDSRRHLIERAWNHSSNNRPLIEEILNVLPDLS